VLPLFYAYVQNVCSYIGTATRLAVGLGGGRNVCSYRKEMEKLWRSGKM
jgi:hypothetical protein